MKTEEDTILPCILKDVYIRPKSILKTFMNKVGERKLRKYLYWGYIITSDIKASLEQATGLKCYESGIKYKEVIQSYYKYVTIRLTNNKKVLEIPAVVYYRVFYPSTIESGKVDISINSDYVDIPAGMNLVSETSHFAGPCIITYIDHPRTAPKGAIFNTNGILPENLEGQVYLKEKYGNICIYTKHKKPNVNFEKKELLVVGENTW